MNKTVLVVDDDEPLRSALCEGLVDEGYSAVGVANGQEALEYLAEASTAPCMIFLDLMMPVMNGYQFREEQKSRPELAVIPVVVLSANGNVDKSSIDANDFIRKPFALDTLLDTVERYCPCC